MRTSFQTLVETPNPLTGAAAMLLPVWQVRQYALALALAEPSPRERKASEHRAILREARPKNIAQMFS